MDLLFFAELIARPDRSGFKHKRTFPADLELDFVVAALEAGLPAKLPEEAFYFEAWGDFREVIDTHDVRRQLREIAENQVQSANAIPKSGRPPRTASVLLDSKSAKRRCHVVVYGGKLRDCKDRREYCLWVLTLPDNKNADKLTAAVAQMEASLAELQAPEGFRKSLDHMEELLATVEQYSQDRLKWLSRGCEVVALDQSAVREFQSHISELLDTSSGISRPQELRGANRERRLRADWRSFFRDISDLNSSIAPNMLKGLVEEFLGKQVGERFNSATERKAFAKIANETVTSLGFRFACTGELEDGSACNRPAALRCDEFNERDGGIFYFTHTLRAKTFKHGFSTVVPSVNLVPPAPRAARTTKTSPTK